MLHAGNYLFYMLFVAALFQLDWIIIAASVFVLKNIIQAIVYHKAAKKLEEKDLLAGFLLFEFLLLFLYPFWHMQKRFIKTRKWKN